MKKRKHAVRSGAGSMCNICGRNCGKGGALKKHIEGSHKVDYSQYKKCFYGCVSTKIADRWIMMHCWVSLTFILILPITFSGCASTVAVQPRIYTINLKSNQPFLKNLSFHFSQDEVKVAGEETWHPEKSFQGSLILKFLPDIPDSLSISGIEILSYDSKGRLLSFSSDADWASNEVSKLIIFSNDKFNKDLKEKGKAYKISPDTIRISIKCDLKQCLSVVDPPEVVKDGEIVISAVEVIDKKRLAEIRKEKERQRLAEEKAEAERRRQEQRAEAKSKRRYQEAWNSLNRSGLANQIRYLWIKHYSSVGWGSTACIGINIEKSRIRFLNDSYTRIEINGNVEDTCANMRVIMNYFTYQAVRRGDEWELLKGTFSIGY